jgi:hypothetical protein
MILKTLAQEFYEVNPYEINSPKVHLFFKTPKGNRSGRSRIEIRMIKQIRGSTI